VLDSTAGFVVAYKSCAWARLLAEKAGVKFILDPTRGKVTDIKETSADDGKTRPVVVTADGTSTVADLVVVAGGGWTPSLLPEVSDLLETTAGSVATVTIPASRPDLRDRFGPEKCPVLSWGMRGEKGIYSLPVNADGILKVGYRGTK
jgi:sarcosine oxidase/L-pipecolate oxidase